MRKALALTVWITAMAPAGWCETPQTPAAATLLRTGRAVEAFWSNLMAVTCHEQILQAKLERNGKVVARQEATYDYLVLAQLAPDNVSVQESRLKLKETPTKTRQPLLVTSGFSTLLLILHPFFQGSYEFGPPEPDTLDGTPVLRIAFRQLRGARSPSCLRLRGRDYTLEWRGTAWVERDSGTVRRISVELNNSMEDVGLSSLKADVRYAPVAFSGSGEFCLPVLAEIEAASPKQRWRNVHRFTDYRRFSVETTTRPEVPR